jgi:FkbM family methyltransferase
MNKTITYAQNREDLILAGFFSDDEIGFYVDIGANSPSIDSVTKLFYDRGWSGINIEPIRSHYEQLKEHRTRDKNLNIGISNKTDKLSLREYDGTGLSTFSNTIKVEYEGSPNYFTEGHKDYEVNVDTLANVFTKNKVKRINFMKVDVEGYEYNVLIGNNWSVYRPEVICIEANHIEQDWHNILKDNDYELVFFDGLNEYFIDKKIKMRRVFSYVESVINKEPIVNYRLLPEMKKLEESQSRVFDLEKEIELKNSQITHLAATLGELMPLRRHFKRQLKTKLKYINKNIYNKLKSRNTYVPLGVNDVSVKNIINIDAINFIRYNQSKRAPLRLKIYLGITGFMIRMASRVLRITKV